MLSHFGEIKVCHLKVSSDIASIAIVNSVNKYLGSLRLRNAISIVDYVSYCFKKSVCLSCIINHKKMLKYSENRLYLMDNYNVKL